MDKIVGADCYIAKQIGSTLYRVKVCFKESANETMEQKILRIIDRELTQEPYCNSGKTCGIIKAPQMNLPV